MNEIDYRLVLLKNIDNIHTTKLGYQRITNALEIDSSKCIEYIKGLLMKPQTKITKSGKNYYLFFETYKITINSYNYCVITAHNIKEK